MTEEDERLLQETAQLPRQIILNKCDLGCCHDMKGAVKISAATGTGMDALRALISEKAAIPAELPLVSERHMILARKAAAHLNAAADALTNGEPLDLCAIDLHAALETLGEVTGDRVDEKLLDSVFSRFCVGK